MEQLAKAILLVDWHGREPEQIPVQYNPTELSFDKSAQIAEIAIPGLDSPLQQFVRGQAEKLTSTSSSTRPTTEWDAARPASRR